MTFQSNVRQFQTTGIQGEIAREGPIRVAPWNLDPAGANANPNTVGFAFTKQADGDAVVGGDAGIFVGILMQPKEHALVGVGTTPLNPTLDLADGVVGSLLTMGIIFVDATVIESGTVGSDVFYDDLTGAIGLGTAGIGETPIANAKVVLEDIAAVGLAIIELTS